MICLAVTFVIQPGREDEAIELFNKLTVATRTEPGCLMYIAHRSPSEPRRFFLYEQYVDQAALDAHRAAPHFVEYGANGAFKLAESRSPEIYEPLAP
jgi:quinol monooxygenase YgiN